NGQLTIVRHPDRSVHFRAQATENALAQVEPGGSPAIRVLMRDGSRRTNRGCRSRVVPVGPVDLRFPAGLAGDFRRRLWIVGGDDAGLQTLTQGFKHGL